MRRIKLVNAYFVMDGPFPPFTVEGYTFRSTEEAQNRLVITSDMIRRRNRNVRQNAVVEFSHDQSDSLIFAGGRIGTHGIVGSILTRKRKRLEDILLLASVLTGYNWDFYSRRRSLAYPVVARSHMETVSKDSSDLANDLPVTLSRISDPAWRQRFNNGFHLRVLFGNANVLNKEARFLAQAALWELLYSLQVSESENLHQIVHGLLGHYWPNLINHLIFRDSRVSGISGNIFYVLRNQLAHNGRLPIDRNYAEQWMKDLPVGEAWSQSADSVYGYMTFFDRLTQVLVLKTVGLDVESRLAVFDFETSLNRFLHTGRL